MSILIKGMQMPINCSECALVHQQFDGEQSVLACFAVCEPVYDVSRKLPNCPLEKVPEPHGRLIDADSFKDYILNGYNEARSIFSGRKMEIAKSVTFGFLRDIDERPTIIPEEVQHGP